MSNIKVVAILTAHDGKAEALHDLLEGLIAPSRSEPGNLRYDLWTDPETEGRFVLDELYIDASANAAHRATPHFQHYLSRIGDLADRIAVALDPLNVV